MVLGSAIGRGRNESRVCGVCHARRCELCIPRRALGCSVCGAPGSSPPLLAALVGLGRPVAVRVLPGLAGIAADKPFVGWTAALAAATAGAAFVLREGVVPDPLVAGHAGQVAFTGAAALLAGIWVTTTWWSLRSLR